ncbi:MAG TPA: hypothetical protein DCW74_10035 [Alteromonas australica]|uniref:DUF3570 domain-containing protein n=2 Tax=Alteromonas australica TaxID=589873 RepID=A0A358E2X6_9ALTE|nr:hypothetical protein [Alteromonas australica]MAF71506.1 hypothetical protein [Alteromonas sp.]MBU33193.1 hypothetical protein [Alteromonas sp.]HAI72831.1 hypothetical protein [Alteromonas australica]HAW76057.1 hypothetical protein [Alteromonas australica]HBU52563.1 hypothetical protein [Alteromonas australica]|tara:strand:- start:2151 stop:3107 length:957 start_codon:yes stop_codon:yes gene_type:complete
MLCVAVTLCHLMSPSSTLLNSQPVTAIQSPQDSVDDSAWFDVWQRSFTDSIDFTVRQFDGMFSQENGPHRNKQAKAEGRIQLSWEPRSRDLAETDLRFRIRVSLPHLEDRVDLLLSDNEDETQSDTLKAARNDSLGRRDNTTIALRFRPDQNSHYSYRIGAGRRDQLYVKSRYRDAMAFNAHWAMLYDAELYYYTRDRLGAELGAAIQHVAENNNVTRLNNRFYFRDDSNDWLWRHELQHLYPIDTHNALMYRLMVEGLDRPQYKVEEFYTGLRWRSNPLREWLYFDVEPFVLWRRDEGFKPSYGMAFRIEAYYGKAH